MSARAMTPPTIARRGLMLVLSSPSGAGKTSIARALLGEDDGIAMSISVTTRPIRNGEEEGKDYFFVDAEKFTAMAKAGELLEHAEVFGHRYGTPRAPVEAALARGRDVLFDIDWQGTQQLHAAARDDLVSVFVLPPTMVELERRLRARKRDPEKVVHERMARAADELSHWAEYNYAFINEDLVRSVARVLTILRAERLKRDRQPGLADFVNNLREG
ncbi:MAG: guanylate kinase [Alphaproteobacteria bacterium]|nr:guanylate kinase [Alphaproteobacteria bacterium]